MKKQAWTKLKTFLKDYSIFLKILDFPYKHKLITQGFDTWYAAKIVGISKPGLNKIIEQVKLRLTKTSRGKKDT